MSGINRYLSAIIFVPLISLFIFGCGRPASLREYADSREVIEEKSGNQFVILLKSNRTTGYEWQIEGLPENNIVINTRSEYIPDETGLVGSGGTEKWYFTANRPGSGNIDFIYVRPWENKEPEKKDTFRIRVE